MDHILQEYLESKFYADYKDTYFSDSIIRYIIQKEIKRHQFRATGKNQYNYIYEKMLRVMEDYIRDYAAHAKLVDDRTKWEILYSMYVDPDPKSIKEINGVKCTADGLLSIRRIHQKFGLSAELIEEYRIYRRTPIFHFPAVYGGINQSRAMKGGFGDRIDHTLFDLKRYCDGHNNCRLQSAYMTAPTAKWLESFDYDFSRIVDEWFGVRGIFVDDNDKVLDLEYSDGTTIKQYSASYSWQWSDRYYENLKKKILEFEGDRRKQYENFCDE